jgi:hypothetical protein
MNERGRFAVFLTWEELFGRAPTELEVHEVLRTFNRQNTVLLLARLAFLLFLDRFLCESAQTIQLQGFLIVNFFDDEILNQAKLKFPSEHLDYRRAFHLQQVLTILKWTVLYAAPNGGIEPDPDSAARFALGRCLLKTSDLLLSVSMKADIAHGRQSRSLRRFLRLQLQAGAGNEISNPPPVVNGVVRGETIFGEMMGRIRAPMDLSRQFEERTGIPLETYVDLTLGVLANYIGRTRKEVLEDPKFAVIDPNIYFGNSISGDLTKKYWQMESHTVDCLADELSNLSFLKPQQDFTALRMKPFLRLENGMLVCVNPGFIQEKLEVGLFWTIVNSLALENRGKAFEAWGNLFQEYVGETLGSAIDREQEEFVPFPMFKEKRNRHESFDGIIRSGRVCVVFEYKAGFLPNKAKYDENLDEFVSSLEQKFGVEAGAGIEQLVRKISQVFSSNEKLQRKLKGIDLTGVDIVIPILVVQDGFVSSLLTVPWLAKAFRDLMRKRELSRKVVCPSLLVMHVEDVENLSTYAKAGKLSVVECLLYAAKKGDPGPGRLFAFADTLREFLAMKKISRVPENDFDKKFEDVVNRVTLRLFDRKFERK